MHVTPDISRNSRSLFGMHNMAFGPWLMPGAQAQFQFLEWTDRQTSVHQTHQQVVSPIRVLMLLLGLQA
jgi:hypothetical protein